MKKKITVGILVVMLLATGTVYGAMLWAGSDNVSNIKDNLELIQIKMDGLESENNETIREIEILLEQEVRLREQRERELADKQTEIENKIAEIQEKNQEIQEVKSENDKLKEQANQVDGLKAEVENLKNEKAVLTTDNNALSGQLEQALKDVQEIERITDGMVQ